MKLNTSTWTVAFAPHNPNKAWRCFRTESCDVDVSGFPSSQSATRNVSGVGPEGKITSFAMAWPFTCCTNCSSIDFGVRAILTMVANSNERATRSNSENDGSPGNGYGLNEYASDMSEDDPKTKQETIYR